MGKVVAGVFLTPGGGEWGGVEKRKKCRRCRFAALLGKREMKKRARWGEGVRGRVAGSLGRGRGFLYDQMEGNHEGNGRKGGGRKGVQELEKGLQHGCPAKIGPKKRTGN